MAKFLNYEDWLKIENGLREHMTFTQIGEKLGRDRTTITKEVRNYSIERDTVHGRGDSKAQRDTGAAGKTGSEHPPDLPEP